MWRELEKNTSAKNQVNRYYSCNSMRIYSGNVYENIKICVYEQMDDFTAVFDRLVRVDIEIRNGFRSNTTLVEI